MVCIDGAAEGDDHLLCTWELCHELLAYALELCSVHLALSCSHIETLRLDAEHLLRIFLVSENHIAAGNELRHHFRCCLAVFPEVLSVVKVA